MALLNSNWAAVHTTAEWIEALGTGSALAQSDFVSSAVEGARRAADAACSIPHAAAGRAETVREDPGHVRGVLGFGPNRNGRRALRISAAHQRGLCSDRNEEL